MKRYNNILVVAEPKHEIQYALKRALEMTKFNPKASITFLRIVYDYESDLLSLKSSHPYETEASEEMYVEALNKTINKYREAAGSESTVLPLVIRSRDIGQSIVKEINTGKYDLVIKAANSHGILDSIIFTPIDWYILRKSNVPVIIAKENEWHEGGNIVISVDFSVADYVNLNLAMLREAQILAKLTRSTIHLVNSAPVYFPSIMLEVPQYSPNEYEAQVLEDHRNLVYEFAKNHNIPKENCHIEEGMPDDVLPKLCAQLNAKYVFIGSSCRTGVMAALIGNTCEEIVDEVDADLFVLNTRSIRDRK